MRRLLLPAIALVLIAAAACNRKEPESCVTVPASQNIRFRLVDSTGADILLGGSADVQIQQPCRPANDPLRPRYDVYRIAGSSDSATILSFDNLANPEYGTGIAECYRIYFRYPGGDEDTVDWHYRQDISGNCVREVIDYMSYNGIQAAPESSFGRQYYRIIKRNN